jgi:hypothetical protein
MSEKQFWNWTALGVTPLTVGKNLLKNRRKKQHRRNEFLVLNDDSNTVVYITTATAHESMEVKLENNYRRDGLNQRNCYDDECSEYSSSIVDSDSPRIQPESTFVFDDGEEIDKLTGFRLSLAGLGAQSKELSSSQSSKSSDDHRDELHSNLYSSVLETVRNSLVERIPQISDEMISRAIINAFADSNLDRRSYDSFDRDELYHCGNDQVEVNILCKAYTFMYRRQNQLIKERELIDFLQLVLDEMFLKIRREEITSSDEVLRTISSVLSILKIKVDNSVIVPRDTILLRNLPYCTTRNDLFQKLSRFGKIKAVAVATIDDRAFGYCCFHDEITAQHAIANQGTIKYGVDDAIISIMHRPGKNGKEASGKQPDGLITCAKTGRVLWAI